MLPRSRSALGEVEATKPSARGSVLSLITEPDLFRQVLDTMQDMLSEALGHKIPLVTKNNMPAVEGTGKEAQACLLSVWLPLATRALLCL